MTDLPISLDASEIKSTEDEIESSRLLVVLYPNTNYLAITLSDRKFNNERYNHTRDIQPEGAEKKLLEHIEFNILGVTSAKALRNKLVIEVEDGTRPRDVIPQIITALKEWGSGVEPYNPAIFCQDQRWENEPIERDFGFSSGGNRFAPGAANIGVSYKPWSDI